MSNPKSRGQQRDKPYRDALRMAATELDQIAPGAEPVCRYPKGSLRWIAWHQLLRAGDDTSAAKEVADRLDGKVAQPIAGDDELPPVGIETIERVIVDPKATNTDR